MVSLPYVFECRLSVPWLPCGFGHLSFPSPLPLSILPDEKIMIRASAQYVIIRGQAQVAHTMNSVNQA